MQPAGAGVGTALQQCVEKVSKPRTEVAYDTMLSAGILGIHRVEAWSVD